MEIVCFVGGHFQFYIKDNSLIKEDNSVLDIQYIPRNMHTVFALLCFVVVIHWLIFPYPSGLLHWHCGNLTIAPVPAKQPGWIWINTSCELIMNDCITTTKQSTTNPCAYFLGYTVYFAGFFEIKMSIYSKHKSQIRSKLSSVAILTLTFPSGPASLKLRMF